MRIHCRSIILTVQLLFLLWVKAVIMAFLMKEHILGLLFPGQNGEIYHGHLTGEDFTTNGVIPILNGTIPTTDTTNGSD